MGSDSAPDIARIAPAGDSALLIEFPQEIAPRINTRAIALADRLRRRCGTAVRDAVVGYATVTVYFNPLVVDAAWMEAEVRAVAGDMEETAEAGGTAVEVPVCYGGEFGPDLADVASFAGCSEDAVVDTHADGSYRVYMVGFVPGFAYMASVDPRIAAPRRATPRAAVPAGSVAIAGAQTGIYPTVTPGGWNIIGRTPVRLFDPARARPFLLEAGDAVRFRSISRQEFDRTR